MAQIRYEWRGQDDSGAMVSLVIEDETSASFLYKVKELDKDGRFKDLLPEKK